MKRFVQRNVPLIAVFCMLLFCIGMGIATRLSFTNAIADPNLPKSPYWYHTQTPKSINDSAEILSYGSGLVAVVKPQGEKGYLDRSLLTNAEVLTVYQGDPAMQGQTILIYEPIQLGYSQLKYWMLGEDRTAHNFILSIYPNLTPEDSYLNVQPQVEAMNNHAPMVEGREYLVFLTTKKYPPEHALYQQTHEYNFVQSVYAVLDLSAPEEDFVPSPEFLTWAEAEAYPVLLNSQADLDVYMKNRKEIQNEILGK